MSGLGLGYARLKALNPGVVLTSISNFGQTGPYKNRKATEIVEYATGGPMLFTGAAHREPVKLGGSVGMYFAGQVAALATLGAFYRGMGDRRPGRPHRRLDNGDPGRQHRQAVGAAAGPRLPGTPLLPARGPKTGLRTHLPFQERLRRRPGAGQVPAHGRAAGRARLLRRAQLQPPEGVQRPGNNPRPGREDNRVGRGPDPGRGVGAEPGGKDPLGPDL